MQNINVVVFTGNLTRDPKLRTTVGGTKVCNLRVAVNGRRKNGNDEYVDKPNYFNVTVWGAQGEAGRGRSVTIHVKPYGDDAHTFIEFQAGLTPDSHRYWGTSNTNPGGGPGWIPESAFSASYLAGFQPRHPPGL